MLKAMRDLANGRPLSGIEKEASDATAKRIGREAKGFFIPHDVAAAHIADSHDLNAYAMKALADSVKNLSQSVFGSGGALVGTNLLTDSLIELLRNKPLVSMMGARTLSGLVGNIALPSMNGGATAYWLSESGTATNSDQSFGQLGLTPKRLVGRTGYTKELLNQTDLSVEALVRDDITTVLGLAKDLAALNGSGGAQPLGILNTTGINTVTFGATATRQKATDFQKEVAVDNASRGALAYMTTPTTAGKWMNVQEATNYPKFLWDGNIDQGNVVGRPAYSTNQVPSDKVIYGNWNDLILADWAGMDVVVNPYTNDATGVVTITITLWSDIAVRHAVSFCVSTDSGAQ
jgi:HK97 family phage major capsid protein